MPPHASLEEGDVAHAREGHGTTEGRDRGDVATAEESHSHQNLEEAKNGFSLRASGGSMAVVKSSILARYYHFQTPGLQTIMRE